MGASQTLKKALTGTLGLTKRVVDSGRNLIESLLGEPCRVAGNLLADQVLAWQWKNRIRIAHNAEKLLKKDHLAPKMLPPAFLLPLLDAAGNVDDEDLQELWAHLLASAVADDKNQHPAFVQILRQLSKHEAILLSLIARARFRVEETFDYDPHAQLFTARAIDPTRSPFNRLNCTIDIIKVYISHLSALGLIVPSIEEETIWDRNGPGRQMLGRRLYTHAQPTQMGRQFLLACYAYKDLAWIPVDEPWQILGRTTGSAREAKNAADEALEAAEEAKQEAEEAKDSAEEAKDEAEQAKDVAEDAKASAATGKRPKN